MQLARLIMAETTDLNTTLAKKAAILFDVMYVLITNKTLQLYNIVMS